MFMRFNILLKKYFFDFCFLCLVLPAFVLEGFFCKIVGKESWGERLDKQMMRWDEYL